MGEVRCIRYASEISCHDCFESSYVHRSLKIYNGIDRFILYEVVGKYWSEMVVLFRGAFKMF